MILKPMKFKNFVWPHNPSNYDINFNKKIITHEYPEVNGGEIEILGSTARVITGNGIFFGKDAHLDFQRLATIYADKTPGILFHPKWNTIPNAVLTKLQVTEEPIPEYVAYTFEFMEHTNINVIKSVKNTTPSKSPTTTSKTNTTSNIYIVKKGDTLWDISKKYYNGDGTKWKDIANTNKNTIKNPNNLSIGQKIIIP